MKNWPDIYFARHGETDWNAERRYQGKRDIPLNEKGRAQADALGPLLVNLLNTNNSDPGKISWYASPLSRAAETMERTRAAFSQELPDTVFDDRLMEISFGVMEGKLHSELPASVGIKAGQRPPGYWSYQPPQGESYHDVTVRVSDFVQQLTGTSVIVAHGGVLRVFRHLIEQAPIAELVNWPPAQGAIAHFHHGQMDLHYADL